MAETRTVISGHKDRPDIIPFETMRAGAFHPEREPDEIFLIHGNAWTLDVFYGGYASRRRGVRVIDDYGNDRTADTKAMGIFPIFAKKAEYDQLKTVNTPR